MSSSSSEKVYDVCVIGAGPAALSVLSALNSPERLLNDRDIQRRNLTLGGFSKTLSVCVIDPAGCWMAEWKGRFKALGIDYLRSPAWATPDYNNNGSISNFARKHGRESEFSTYEVHIPKDASAELKEHVDGGLYKLPGSALFNDFCAELAKELPHDFVKGSARDVIKLDDNCYRVIDTEGAQLTKSRHVVFALGATCTPTIPQQLASLYGKCCSCTGCSPAPTGSKGPKILHSYSWQKLQALPLDDQTVVVIGGGLSAVQSVLLAARRGAKRAILISRRALRSRLYDLSIEWFNTRAGWRKSTERSKSKAEKFRMYEFYDTPKEERRDWVRSARDGATVPPYYLKELQAEVAKGTVEHYVDEISSAECNVDDNNNDGGCVHLSFAQGTAPVIQADRIILATGSTLDINKLPLLKNVTESFDLPLIKGLPDLNNELMWGEENFSVVGALSLMQVGPEAGNLSGCRRCAERCAQNLGAFKKMWEKHGPLGNRFEGFAVSSDESSECDSDSDSDSDSKGSESESGSGSESKGEGESPGRGSERCPLRL